MPPHSIGKRTEHMPARSRISGCVLECWEKVMMLVKQMVLERDEGLRLIALKIS